MASSSALARTSLTSMCVHDTRRLGPKRYNVAQRRRYRPRPYAWVHGGRPIRVCAPGERADTLSHHHDKTPAASQKTLTEKVKTSESFWTLEDGELHVTLCKLAKGVPWPSVFAGDEALDALGGEAEKKRLMLQRFQEEVRIASRGSVWGDHEGGPAHPASA